MFGFNNMRKGNGLMSFFPEGSTMGQSGFSMPQRDGMMTTMPVQPGMGGGMGGGFQQMQDWRMAKPDWQGGGFDSRDAFRTAKQDWRMQQPNRGFFGGY